MEEEIIYYLKLLHFVKPSEITEDELNNFIDFINNKNKNIPFCPGCSHLPDERITFHDNIICEVPDKMMCLGLIRDAKYISKSDNNIIYNKKKYKFNNVYTAEEYENLIFQTVDFTNKRITAGKDSSIIFHGYSGSGKSTLLDKILINYSDHKKYKLYEIYLNKLYIYHNGLKIQVDDIEDDKYIFNSSNIRETLNKFARKKSNGINSNSSRAHTVLELIFENCKLTCIDLAGNERSTIKELKDETMHINKSLFNLSRYLSLGNKYKERGCVLLNIIKKTANILFTVIFNDSGSNNLAVNHLLLLKDFLKSIVPQITEAIL